jgi:hypothetical protein
MAEWMILGLPAAALAVTALVTFLSVRARRGSLEELAVRQKEQPLAHELPYWAFVDIGDQGVAVHVDFTHSAFAELVGLDTDCMDAEALNQTSHAVTPSSRDFNRRRSSSSSTGPTAT